MVCVLVCIDSEKSSAELVKLLALGWLVGSKGRENAALDTLSSTQDHITYYFMMKRKDKGYENRTIGADGVKNN